MRGHPPSPELPHFPGLHLIYHVLHSFPDALQCHVLLINFIFSRVPNLSSLFEVFFFSITVVVLDVSHHLLPLCCGVTSP